MHKFKRGTLKSGKGGKSGKVKSLKQVRAFLPFVHALELEG